jgi:hypothetical protein
VGRSLARHPPEDAKLIESRRQWQTRGFRAKPTPGPPQEAPAAIWYGKRDVGVIRELKLIVHRVPGGDRQQ